MSTTPEFNAAQLAAARTATWHQDGNAIVTLEDMRPYVYEHGLLLFAPRAGQLPVPAPSLIEATLGVANAEPTLAETAVARSLVARLVAEGNALPLNLLGEPGDAPDFIVSAQVFSFIYTLRGDKTWKQAPSTGGSSNISPLGASIYEALSAKGGMTASELALELGRELTESAVTRALTELWSNLRVIPLYDLGDGATIWELTTRRFTKAIKAGTNAGQPTALSALISLYLGQSYFATEEEIEIFLSPLAARSRTREVLHALRSSRQLDEAVLDGKSLLFVPGTLPAFATIEVPVAEGEAAEGSAPAATLEGEGRIKRFTASSEDRPKREYKGKPAFGREERSPRFAPKTDRERKPFTKSPTGRAPSSRAPRAAGFTKPWEEDKKPRAPRADGDRPAFKKFDGPRKPFVRRDADGGSDRPARPSFGAKKSYGDKPRSFDGPKRPYTPRGEAGDRPARPSFGAKKAFGDKPRSFDGPKRPYTPRGEASDRPARPSFGAKREYGDKPRSFDGPKRPYTPRGEAGDRPARPSFGAKKAFGDKPAFRKFDAPKRPYTPRGEGDGGSHPAPRSFDGNRPKAPYRSASGDGPKPRVSFGAKPGGFKKEGGFKPAGDRKPSFAKKPGGFSKSSGDKVSSGSRPPRGVNPRTTPIPSRKPSTAADRKAKGGTTDGPKVSFPRKRRDSEE